MIALWLTSLALAGELRGQLVDPDGGPVPNATVVAYDQRLNYVTATTDEDGVYAITELTPNPYRVRILPPRALNLVEQYAPEGISICGAQRFHVGDGVLDVGTTILERGGEIEGRLVDQQGNPVSGAQVGVRPMQGEPQLSPRYATSDAEGNFRVRGVRSGFQHKLDISAVGWPRQLSPGVYLEELARPHVVVQGGTLAVGTIALVDGVAVTGHVTGPGGPVSMGEVHAFSPSQLLVAATAEDGGFEIVGLPPGDVLVWATGPDIAHTYYPDLDRPGPRLPAADGDLVEGVELFVPASGRATGRVPVAGDTSGVSVVVYNDDQTLGFGAPVDEDGSFLVEGLHPGTYSLHVFGASAGLVDDMARDDDGAPRTVEVPEGGEGSFGEVAMPLGASVEGVITRRYTGEPVYGAQVYAQRIGSDSGVITSSGDDGAFRMLGLQPGTWRLWVEYQAWCGTDSDHVSRFYPDQVNPLFIGALSLRPGQQAEWNPRVPPDDDHDRMDDVWEEEMGLDPTRNDADEDPDGDGYSNYEEYLLGTHPLVAEGGPPCTCSDGRAALWLSPGLALWGLGRRRRRSGVRKLLVPGVLSTLIACTGPDPAGPSIQDTQDTAGPAESKTAHLRVVNLLGQGGAVEIRLDGDVLIEGLAAWTSSDQGADYLPIPSGAAAIEVLREGEPVIPSGPIELRDDDYFTLILHGEQGAHPPSLQVLTDNVYNTMLGMHHTTVHHLAPDLGSVAIWFDEAQVLDALDVGARSPMLMGGVGTVRVGVGPVGGEEPSTRHPAPFRDNAWSYLYLQEQAAGPVLIQHHRGEPLDLLPPETVR